MSAAQLRSIEYDEDRPAPSLWRNRDFVVLWCGQAVSSVGTQVSGLAFPLLVLAITHSAAQTGLIAAVRGIPFVLLTLPAGVLVDRWDRKRLMLWSDVGRAIALGSVPLAMMLGWLTLWQLAVASLLEGTLFTFYNVAEVACLPRIVPREQLGSAVAQSQAIDASSGLVGPALSGALYGLSHAVPFLVDAVSYGASVLSLCLIRTELQEERVPAPLRLWPEMREGFLWLWHHRTMRFLALLMSVLLFFSNGYPIFFIVRAQSMHASSFAIGLLFASGGVGGLAGSLLAGRILRRYPFGKAMLVAGWIWVLTWPPYAFAPNLVTLGLANMVGWLIIPVVMSMQFSYRVSAIPDELQGRVNSVFKLMVFGSEPLALALAGVLTQSIGAPSTILVLTVPQAVMVIVATVNRSFRAARMTVAGRRA